jgi:hypothetical protein
MSLYDKASIALIPSGFKATSGNLGKVYSVLPANGNGDFTHGRGSTATRVNKDGLIESVAIGEADLDYPLTSGVVGDCPHLLLEPSRTNSLTYSTLAFNGGSTPTGWVVGFGTGTFSHTETTYKGQGAVKHTQSTTGRSYLSETISLSASTTYILRVEFDRNNSSLDDNDYIVSIANMSNSFSKQWADVDDDGILEVQFTTGTDAYGELRLGFGVAGNEDGGKTIVFSMPQIEAGSYATSYIPTTSSSVTRSADVCNGSGTSAEFNDSEGVLFVEFKGFTDTDVSNRYITISDGTISNSIGIQLRNSGELRLYNNGTVTANMIYRDAYADLTQNFKIAIKYGNSTSDYKVYINGVSKTIASGFTATSISGLDVLNFHYASNTLYFYGLVKQAMVFNEALTDSELATLTS